ncbi:MAG: TolC family protein [Prevotellaceae bacterium]|jgi:outer membrane protein TolC|nr:TolC family protein [Prevotellaceae bacterium]
MFKRSLTIAVAFLLLAFDSVYAQRVLSLEECRNLAIENNNALKIATEQERKAYYDKKEAFTKYLPELSATGAYMCNQKNLNIIPSSAIPISISTPPINIPPVISMSGMTFPVPEELRSSISELGEIDIKNIWVAGISLVQPVFMGGKIIAYNDIRSYAEELATTMKDSKLSDVIVEIDEAYWQVVSVSNKKRLATSYVDLLKKMDSDIEAMVEEGVATKADRLSVSVKLNEADMTLAKAENGLSLAKMLLCQLCGLEISNQIILADENIETLPVDETPIIADVNEAWSNRSEIKSLELAAKIYDKQKSIAVSEFMPNVALTANYLWTNPSAFDGLSNKFAGMWNVGVMVKVPLNFGANAAKLNAAKAESRIKKYELEEAKEKIQLQVNQSSYKLNEAVKKLSAVKANVEKSDENLRYANVGFEEGVISASDAMAAHTAWISAHSELIDAQIDAMLCKIYLNKALGRKL